MTSPRFAARALLFALVAMVLVLVPTQAQASVHEDSAAAKGKVTMRDLAAVVAGSKWGVKTRIARTGKSKDKTLLIEWKVGTARPVAAKALMSRPVSKTGWQRVGIKRHVKDGKYTLWFTSDSPGKSKLRARVVAHGRTVAISTAKVLTVLPAVPDIDPPEPLPGSSLVSGLTGAVDPSNPLVATYLDTVWANVATYWQNNFTAWNYGTVTANHYWPAPGEQIYNGCTQQYEINDKAAYYCSANDYVIFSQQAAVDLWNGLYAPTASAMPGDFALAFALAHEFGHNISYEFGWGPDINSGAIPVRSRELHADCFAGVWTYSAYYQGILEAGDVNEAIALLTSFGDSGGGYPTGNERNAAFQWGYNSGNPSDCDGFIKQYW
jgi:uncharacterized protein